MLWEFDVGITTHDGLKAGITVEYYTWVQVWADDFYEASLLAAQMAHGHDQYVTECLYKL